MTTNPGTTKPADDWLFLLFLKLTRTSKSRIPVTVSIGGFLISGYLINEARFLNIQLSAYGHDNDYCSEADNVLINRINEINHSDLPDSVYFHMSDVRFYKSDNTPVPHRANMCWRGVIAQVEGFSLGRLESEAEPEPEEPLSPCSDCNC